MAAPRKALELFLSLSMSTGAVLAPFSPALAAPLTTMATAPAWERG